MGVFRSLRKRYALCALRVRHTSPWQRLETSLPGRTYHSPDIARIACCDRGYGRPSGRPRMSDPATYCSSTTRIQPPAVARLHTLLHGLATKIRETSGLALVCNQFPVSCLCSLTYLRERLEAFKGLSFTTFSVPDLIWVARLQEPFFHLIWGSGQDWQ